MMDTFLIMVFAFAAKLLSFYVRILMARSLSQQAMHYYTIISPTMIFALTLTQLSLPTAISKLCAQHQAHASILKVSATLLIILNSIVLTTLLLAAPLICDSLDAQIDLKELLYCMLPLFPLASLSAWLKSYLYGVEAHRQAAFSQIPEEALRILFFMLALPLLKEADALHAASLAMLSVSIAELGSILYLLYAVFRKPIQNHDHAQYETKALIHDLCRLSIPATLSRFIGSFTFFIEPMLLKALFAVSIMQDYSTIHGYLMPLITMPSFLSISLSNYLLPGFLQCCRTRQYQKASRFCFFILSCCFAIGILTSCGCYFFAEELLDLLYHNHSASALLKAMAFPFAFFALQPALGAILHALDLSHKAFLDTLYGNIARIVLYFIAPVFFSQHILLISLISGMLITTFFHALRIAHAFHHHNAS